MRYFVRSRHGNGKELKDLSRRKAVVRFCMECSDWSSASIRNCSEHSCLLHPFRNGRAINPKAYPTLRGNICLYCVDCSGKDFEGCDPLCCLRPYRKWSVDLGCLVDPEDEYNEPAKIIKKGGEEWGNISR
jgi:hypothetical protein